MKVIDCFLFYNELDLLYYRLKLLENICDFFVIVEGTTTFKGEAKPFYLKDNWQLFTPWVNRIIHVEADTARLQTDNPWVRETYQRNQILIGIQRLNLSADDIIIVGDCDEIPDPQTITKIKEHGLQDIYSLEQDLYYYNIETKWEDKWCMSKVCDYASLMKAQSIQNLRFYNTGKNLFSNGGWHLSYFGDVNFIRNKIQQFSHQEYNTDEYTDTEKIKERIHNSHDLFGRESAKLKHISQEENTYLPIGFSKIFSHGFVQNHKFPSV